MDTNHRRLLAALRGEPFIDFGATQPAPSQQQLDEEKRDAERRAERARSTIPPGAHATLMEALGQRGPAVPDTAHERMRCAFGGGR